MTSSSFNILDSDGNVSSKYGDKLIELGKNSTDAVIKLCGDKGQIEYIADEGTTDEYIQISSDKLRLKSNGMSSLYSMSTSEDGQWSKSAVNASPSSVDIYSADSVSNSSSISIPPDGITLSTTGEIHIDSKVVSDSHGQFLSIEKGTSGNWSYKKWSNGDVELWGKYTVSGVNCRTAMGSLYRTDALTVEAFPFTVYNPNLTASYESNGYGTFLWPTSYATTTSPPSYYLVRPTAGRLSTEVLNFTCMERGLNKGV